MRVEVVMEKLPLRILVVDDEPDLDLLIRQKFRKRIRSEELEFSLPRTVWRRWRS